MKWKVNLEIRCRLILIRLSIIIIRLGVLILVNERVYIIEWHIFNLRRLSVIFTLVMDFISLLFLGVVFCIRGSVFYYRGGYIEKDKNYNRFIFLVLIFVISMRFIVLSPNIIRILLGWDGLGFVSYGLVIYYQNEKSSAAGILTVLSNRVGDVAILIRIGLITAGGSWNFFISYYNLVDIDELTKFLVVIGATTKRAQIPFSAWLPAAIAAPTPVSALVHSSTLVTAGVYLIIRFYPAVEGRIVKVYLLIISCVTIFIRGLGANFEFDLKKIIALSTLRQLGVILRRLAIGLKILAYFHLLRHALFKALLFICAGQVIHNIGGCQDIRVIGNLRVKIPLTLRFIRLANLALCGFPFLAGFYSKDMILELAFLSWINFISFFLYFTSTCLTVIYSFRLIYFTLTGDYNYANLNIIREENKIIINSLIVLGVGSVVGGRIFRWMIFFEPCFICLSDLIKILVLVSCTVSAFSGYIINLFILDSYKSVRKFVILIKTFIGRIWNIPFIRTKINNYSVIFRGERVVKIGDKGWYEFFGGQGLNYLLRNLFLILNYLHINRVKIFIKIFLIRTVLIIFIYIYLHNLYRISRWSCERSASL